MTSGYDINRFYSLADEPFIVPNNSFSDTKKVYWDIAPKTHFTSFFYG